MSTHIIDRTSNLGEKFIGRCRLCGEENLRPQQANERCFSNPMSADQTLVVAIEDDERRVQPQAQEQGAER